MLLLVSTFRVLYYKLFQIQEISRVERQKAEHTSRVMASKYLEQMAHDKYFLSALCRDERLNSANRQGSLQLQELAHKALADVEKRQVSDYFTKLNSQTVIGI